MLLQPKDVVIAFEEAWNAHDMVAFTALFDSEATFVNRFGRFVKGRQAIFDMHDPIHQSIYRDSVLENELLEETVLTDHVVILHFWSRLRVGTAHPQGSHSIDTLILAVMCQNNTGWIIKALENVTLTDPRSGALMLRT